MDRTKIVTPRLNPALATSQRASRLLGIRGQRDQDDDIRDAFGYRPNDPYVPITFQSIPWFTENVVAGLNLGQIQMPTGSNSYNGLVLGQLLARPAKVIGGWLWMSANWTAGKIHLVLMVEGVVALEYEDTCVIDGSDTVHLRSAAFFVPYDLGYDVADGEAIRASFRTDASFPSGTVDVMGSFLIAYD